MKNIEFTFKTEEVLARYHAAASAGVAEISLLIAEETILNITANNQVDTGAMRASVFVDVSGTIERTRDETIGDATAKAKIPGVKSKRAFEFHASSEGWKPKTNLQGKVGVSANYAHWQETKHIKFLATAIDAIRAAKLHEQIMKMHIARVK